MTKLYRAHHFPANFARGGVFPNPYLERPRRPRTTPLVVHDAADQWFYDHFQTRFRSRALFATGSFAQASNYLEPGAVMINIWPIGDYKLCYSNWVYDLFDSFQNRFAGTAPTSEEITAEMDILGYNCLQNQGLDAAAASNCEVMLAADSFGYEVIKELA